MYRGKVLTVDEINANGLILLIIGICDIKRNLNRCRRRHFPRLSCDVTFQDNIKVYRRYNFIYHQKIRDHKIIKIIENN